jgi:hypothetical protein
MTNEENSKHYDLEDRTLAFAKESRYWLRLIDTYGDNRQEKTRQELIQEATELARILSTILQRSE